MKIHPQHCSHLSTASFNMPCWNRNFQVKKCNRIHFRSLWSMNFIGWYEPVPWPTRISIKSHFKLTSNWIQFLCEKSSHEISLNANQSWHWGWGAGKCIPWLKPEPNMTNSRWIMAPQLLVIITRFHTSNRTASHFTSPHCLNIIRRPFYNFEGWKFFRNQSSNW